MEKRPVTRSVSPPQHRAGSPSVKILQATGNHSDRNERVVKRNAKGGLLITSEELHAAFTLLDADKTGTITLQNLKKRLHVFFPDMTAKEYRFLMNNRKEVTLEDLEELLVDNEVVDFDPTIDAFRAFDPQGTGAISADKLREVFSALHFGELSDEELDILTRAADIDGDGMIGLEDFRAMIDLNRPLTHARPGSADPNNQSKGSNSVGTTQSGSLTSSVQRK